MDFSRIPYTNEHNERYSVLLVGMVPPPTTGAAVAMATLLGSSFADYFDIKHINTSFVQNVGNTGSFSLRKVCLAGKYFAQYCLCLLSGRLDVVIQNHASAGWALLKDSLFSIVAGVIFRRKVILWMHGNGILDYERRNRLSKWIVVAGLRSASCLVVLGEALKRGFARWVPDERMRVIHHGIPNLEQDGVTTDRASNTAVKVLYFSNLIREKGWLVTLAAAAEILRARNDLRFVFCGAWWSPDDEQLASQLVQQWGIRDRVEFRGETLGKDKQRAFAEADIFAFPTFFPVETFGIVNIEAMRSSLPIITTRRGAIPEIVEDGINGFLIPEQNVSVLAERITYLADHPEVRLRMGRANRSKYLRLFTVNRFAEQWIDLVSSLALGGNSRSG